MRRSPFAYGAFCLRREQPKLRLVLGCERGHFEFFGGPLNYMAAILPLAPSFSLTTPGPIGFLGFG